MIRYILLALLVTGGAIEAKHIKCLCEDKTAVLPDCGICGTVAGTMEQTEQGVICWCQNKLKLKEMSCAAVCEKRGGWTGEFRQVLLHTLDILNLYCTATAAFLYPTS